MVVLSAVLTHSMHRAAPPPTSSNPTTMIKRQESSSAASSSIAPPSAAIEDANNGKDKKYQRHGTALEFLRRWIARRGQLAVLLVVAALLSVFLIPPLKVLWNGGASGSIIKAARRLQVPPCPKVPWKEGEDLRGKCPGDLKPFGEAATMSQCASTCCANEECISWQFREGASIFEGSSTVLQCDAHHMNCQVHMT